MELSEKEPYCSLFSRIRLVGQIVETLIGPLENKERELIAAQCTCSTVQRRKSSALRQTAGVTFDISHWILYKSLTTISLPGLLVPCLFGSVKLLGWKVEKEIGLQWFNNCNLNFLSHLIGFMLHYQNALIYLIKLSFSLFQRFLTNCNGWPRVAGETKNDGLSPGSLWNIKLTNDYLLIYLRFEEVAQACCYSFLSLMGVFASAIPESGEWADKNNVAQFPTVVKQFEGADAT